MKRKKSIKISVIILLVAIVILLNSAGVVFARDNYAIGIATFEDNGEFLWD